MDDQSPEDLQSDFEKNLQQKIGGIVACPKAIPCQCQTVVFCGGTGVGGGGC